MMKYFFSFLLVIVCSHFSLAQDNPDLTMPLDESLWRQFQLMLIDRTFLVTALGWITACSLKVVILKFRTGRFHLEQFFSTGGMPSSHSAFASCLTVGIGLTEGFTSAVFGLAMGLTILTAVDAVGLRKEAGLQAECINQILSEINKDKDVNPIKLRETLGHSLPEVLGGIAVGSGIAFLINYIFS